MDTTQIPDWMREALEDSTPLHPALVPWLRETEVMGTMVKHPYIFMAVDGTAPSFLVHRANQVYAKKLKARREILAEKDWWAFLFLMIERPYRMEYLERLYLRNRISRNVFCRLLPEVWKDTEAPQANQSQPLRMFHMARFVTDDHKAWLELASKGEIVLYRGVDGHLELTKDGPSWTTSLDVAKFFAYRFGAKGKVYTYTAKPEEAFAYFIGRDEAEIILDFDTLMGGRSHRSKIRRVK